MIVQGGDPTGGMLPIFVLPPRDVAIGAALMVCMGVLAGVAAGGCAPCGCGFTDALRRQ